MEVFDDEVIAASLKLSKIILSGDIDKCAMKEQICEKQFKTIIAFSKPDIKIPIDVPELEKYSGYLRSEVKEGIVKVEM